MIYADPPWRYTQKGLQGAAEKHYPTMGIDEICALPVADLAAPNSVLFLWATFPQLPEALRLINAWGFTYKSVAFVWLKKNRKSESWFYGLGFWTRGNAEVCLLATRGHPKRQAANVHQFIIAPSAQGGAVRPAVPARLGCVGERGGKHRPGLLDKVSRGGRERRLIHALCECSQRLIQNQDQTGL